MVLHGPAELLTRLLAHDGRPVWLSTVGGAVPRRPKVCEDRADGPGERPSASGGNSRE